VAKSKKTVDTPLVLEFLALDTLVPYAANARTHSETQIDQIAGSISEFGFTNPVLISGSDEIIAGHGRVMAARQLGMETVPCFRLGHLSDEQRRAYVIADNKLALNAGWDEELLKLELGVLRDAGFDLGLTGFDAGEIDALFLDDENLEGEGLIGDDDLAGSGGAFCSERGDVWLLGDHRVMCGDSTCLADVEQLAGGRAIDCCWTDPPYNVNYEGTAGKIQNDHMGDSAFREFLRDAFVGAFAVMRAGAPIYIAHSDTEGFNFRGAYLEAGFKLSGCLVWVKPALVLGRSDYQWRHEPILYGWKEGAAHSWYGGRKKTTVIDAVDVPFVVEPDGGAVQIEAGETTLRISGSDLHVEELVGSVIRAEKPKRSAEHPTMKPVGLVLGMLINSSRRGDAVLDLFGGSGTTLIACQKVGRHSRLMEFDPKYCDVIVRRWQLFSGKKATLEGSGETFDALAADRQKVTEDA
jgi:DNA modification methylase